MLTPDYVLNKTADIIEERGHGHQYYINNNGNVCVVGAMRIACGAEVRTNPDGYSMRYDILIDSKGYDAEAVQLARDAMDAHLEIDVEDYSVVEWNDVNHKDTVVSELRKAAKKAKAE